MNYRKKRLALMNRLPDGLIFLLGGEEIVRNHDVHYVFRQHSHFLYLCGVEKPGYALLLDPGRRQETLLIPRIDQKHRVWQGHVPDAKETKALYSVSRVAYLDELPRILASRKRSLFYGDKTSLAYLSSHFDIKRKNHLDFEEALSELRAVKSDDEIDAILKANQISAKGHLAAMAFARSGLWEYQVQAELEHAFCHHGARHLAYPSIVGAGTNSAVLHYHDNAARLKGGDLLLIDAGAEYKGYAADITRTFPINGRFSPKQRDIYSLVLTTQKRCIATLRPGISMRDLDTSSARIMIEGLKSLKIMSGSTDSIIESGADRVFYPHGIGHMLGLDVHDKNGGKNRQFKQRPQSGARKIRSNIILEPGFVITIEPGLYFIPALLHDSAIRRRFRDFIHFDRAESFIKLGGIRIEDDIAITEGGHRNLTSVPKELEAIEAACNMLQRQ